MGIRKSNRLPGHFQRVGNFPLKLNVLVLTGCHQSPQFCQRKPLPHVGKIHNKADLAPLPALPNNANSRSQRKSQQNHITYHLQAFGLV